MSEAARIIEAALNAAEEPSDACEAVNDCRYIKEIEAVILNAAEHAGKIVTMDDHQSAIDDASAKASEAIERSVAFEADAERLYDAIVSGNRDEAIAILGELTGERFRPVAEQRNLFPDRVPA